MVYNQNEAKEIYQKAHYLHYEEGYIEGAIALYKRIVDEFPASPEAGYAKTQLSNIEKGFTKVRTKKDDPYSNPPVILTTAPYLEGYTVFETIEVITAECVCGIDLIADFFASLTDIVGGRSESTQNILRVARKTVLLELKCEAYELGANAVIAVDLDYNQFSGKGKSSLFVVASGTAVKVKKDEHTAATAPNKPIHGSTNAST